MAKVCQTAPVVDMKNFTTLFIEMTSNCCNSKCSYCFIKTSDKKDGDFIPLDKIKESLSILEDEKLKYICLTGAEPMLHPDFNKILRHCLKHSSVIIYTNGSLINDKKARFFRKVENEVNSEREIIFKVSIDSTQESVNDFYRGRGSFRKSIFALKSLIKYGFNPILSIVNYENKSEITIKNEFKSLCQSIYFDVEDINFKIIPYYSKQAPQDVTFEESKVINFDCATSRMLTSKGIYNCPLLSNDNRGISGSSFQDYSKKNYLETEFCLQCVKHNTPVFTDSWAS